MKKSNRILEGFTLVEILIVVVIIGILATVAIPTYFKYVERGYASDAKVQLKIYFKTLNYFGRKQVNGPPMLKP